MIQWEDVGTPLKYSPRLGSSHKYDFLPTSLPIFLFCRARVEFVDLDFIAGTGYKFVGITFSSYILSPRFLYPWEISVLLYPMLDFP